MDKRKPVGQQQRKAAEQAALMEAPGPERDDAAHNDQAYYRSQKEVDAAFARRLAAARRKWSRDAGAPAMQLPQQDGAPAMDASAAAEPSAQTAPAALTQQMAAQAPAVPQAMPPIPGALPMGQPGPGVSPLMAMGQQMPQSPAAGALPQAGPADGMAATGAADPNGMGMAQADGLNRMALRLLAEEADIQRVFPSFDLESFIASDEGVRDALMQGSSLWSVFAGVYGGIVKQQAEAEALDRIRSRNSAVPDVLRAGGAAGAAAPDYAGMSSDQFNRLRKEYEAQMRMGKKIKP